MSYRDRYFHFAKTRADRPWGTQTAPSTTDTWGFPKEKAAGAWGWTAPPPTPSSIEVRTEYSSSYTYKTHLCLHGLLQGKILPFKRHQILLVNLMFVWPCIFDINNVEDQLDVPITIYWYSNQLNTFRGIFCPSSGAQDCVLQLIAMPINCYCCI